MQCYRPIFYNFILNNNTKYIYLWKGFSQPQEHIARNSRENFRRIFPAIHEKDLHIAYISDRYYIATALKLLFLQGLTALVS